LLTVLLVTRNLKVSVVVERDEDGWFVGSVPELPGCHTQAKSLDELMKRMREAVEAYLETEGKKAVTKGLLGEISFSLNRR